MKFWKCYLLLLIVISGCSLALPEEENARIWKSKYLAAMMDWMRQDQRPKSLATANATNYLLNQLLKRKQVQKLIENALKKARKTIYTHENTSI